MIRLYLFVHDKPEYSLRPDLLSLTLVVDEIKTCVSYQARYKR